MALPLILIAAAAAAQPVQTSIAAEPSHLSSRELARGGPGRPFMSPMGEPFFGRTAGEDGLVAWFQQADRNHDGALTLDEMNADADAFFRTLDTDHDGEIDPDEIAHYETVIAPELRTRVIAQGDSLAAGDQQVGRRGGGYGGGGHGGHGGGRAHRGGGGGIAGGFGGDDEAAAGRYGLLQIPEPVASADADFNRGVSLKEFENAAMQRFRLLDVSQTGRLTLPGLEGIRQAAQSASRRPPKSDKDQEPSFDPDQPQL